MTKGIKLLDSLGIHTIQKHETSGGLCPWACPADVWFERQSRSPSRYTSVGSQNLRHIALYLRGTSTTANTETNVERSQKRRM